ncbi:MAG: LytTR family DNA-binding domain-containing protein [Acidobacteriota bacterium]
MRVIVIEDEPLAAEKLCDFIGRYDDSILVAAKLESVEETRKWFRANKPPDLIFSDIELLDGNVFEFFENEELNNPIIFTTAYDQFLLRAFERNGIAYLLKPFTYENFVAAMLKLEKLKQNFVAAQADLWREIQKNLSEPKYKERFVVKLRGGIQFIETDQIAYFQIQDTILFTFDAAGNKFPLNENLNQLEQILDPQIFFRVNRSEMVNLKFIERLEPYFNDRLMICLRNSKIRLISSTNRTPNLRKWIEGEI